MNNNNFLTLEGDANELLMVNNDETMKCTRLIYFSDDNFDDVENNEVIDVCITSTNKAESHDKFDEILGHKIRITIDLIDDEYKN